MEGILNGFNTDDENVEDEVNVNLDPLGIKKEDFELLKIIQDYKCPSNSTQRNLWWMSNGKENIIRFFQQQIKVF